MHERRLHMHWFSSQFAVAVRRLRDRAARSPSGNSWRSGPDEATRQHDRVLRESADRYLAIFDTEVDAIVVADKFGIIQSFNRPRNRSSATRPKRPLD